jgi:carbon monoxide dehydrogenase subunit G
VPLSRQEENEVAKFPTDVERSIEVSVAAERAHAFLWDVAGSAHCIPGIDRCEEIDAATYAFLYKERSAGPVSMTVRYTARYATNGRDEITFSSTGAAGDNTDAQGTIRITPTGAAVRVTIRQCIAPDTPVPRLVQGMIRSFVEREAAAAVDEYLVNLKRALEREG